MPKRRASYRVNARTLLLASLACSPACSPRAANEPPPPLPQARPLSTAVVASPGATTGPAEACAPPAKSPTCNGTCVPRTLWTKSYGAKDGFAPSIVLARADGWGNLFVAGTTGRGPTSLGGKALYAGWPRGIGEAFIGKYSWEGAHVYSRQLFESSAEERKRGGRSSVWALALGSDGSVHGLASRVGVEQAGTHLVTVSPDGARVKETWVRKGLPTLVELTERGGTISALGVRDEGGPALELAEHHMEPGGAVQYDRRGLVQKPAGNLSMTEARVHPRGVLWTAVRVANDAQARIGGHSICPVHDAEARKDGVLVRTSTTPRAESCEWPATELVAALVGENGGPLWERTFSVPGYTASADAIAVDTSGNTYWVGPFTGLARFGDKTECALPLPQGYVDDYFGSQGWDARCKCLGDYADVFLLKLDAAGNPSWLTRIGDFMEDRAGPLVIDSGGNVVFAVGSAALPDFAVARRKRASVTWKVLAYGPSGNFLWAYPTVSDSPPVLASGAKGTTFVVETAREVPGIRITALQTPP